MKKNLLLTSILLLTTTLGQAAWASTLRCTHHTQENVCFPRSYYLTLDQEHETFEFTETFGLGERCFRWPPAPIYAQGKVIGQIGSHLGLILKGNFSEGAEFFATATGDDRMLTLALGEQIIDLDCKQMNKEEP